MEDHWDSSGAGWLGGDRRRIGGVMEIGAAFGAKLVGSASAGLARTLFADVRAMDELEGAIGQAVQEEVEGCLPAWFSQAEVTHVLDTFAGIVSEVDPVIGSGESVLRFVQRLVVEVVGTAGSVPDLGSDYEPESWIDSLVERGADIEVQSFAVGVYERLRKLISVVASAPGSPLAGFAALLGIEDVSLDVKEIRSLVETQVVGPLQAIHELVNGREHELTGPAWTAPVGAPQWRELPPVELMLAELGNLAAAGLLAPGRAEALHRLEAQLDDVLGVISTTEAVGAVVEHYHHLGLQRYRLGVALRYERANYRGIADEAVTGSADLADMSADTVFVAPLGVAERVGDDERRYEADLLEQLDRVEDPVERERHAAELRAHHTKQWEITQSDQVAVVELLAELESCRHAVVRGVPGAGKSTLTRFMAHTAVLATINETAAPLSGWLIGLTPIRVELAGFAHWRRTPANWERTLRNYIDEVVVGSDYADVVGAELTAGRGLVLLDGFDEEPDETLRIKMAARIEEFIRDHSHNRIVITSRPIGYQRIGGAVPHFDLAPLSDDKMAQFAFQWQYARLGNRDLARTEAARDIEEITKNPNITQIGRRPLILVLLLLRRYADVRLPDQRVKLYDQLVHSLIERWNAARSETQADPEAQQLDANTLMPLLAQVAYNIHRHHTSGRVPHAEAKELLSQAIKDQDLEEITNPARTATAYIDALTDRAGLIQHNAAGYLSFWHLTFEEYLAGIHLANHDGLIEVDTHTHIITELCVEGAWAEVFVLATGHLRHVVNAKNRAYEFVRLIQNADIASERYQTRRAQRIAHILSDDPHLAPTATRQLTEFVITSSHRIPSLTAAETFTTLVATYPALELDDPLAIEALVDLAANHTDWSARRDATRLLANIARTNRTAQQACTDQLLDVDANVQIHAWLAPTTPADTPAPRAFTAQHAMITGKDQPTKIEALVDLMTTTTNDNLRYRVAAVLVSVDSTVAAAVEALVDLMTTTTNDNLRYQVAQVLESLPAVV